MSEITKMLCPRVKRAAAGTGELLLTEIRLFTVGDGERFARALNVFLPDLPVRAVSREEANAVLSVARVFSGREEFCALRISETGIEITARDGMGARNAAAILAQLAKRDGEGYRIPAGTVEDYPDASYRGMMLESSGRSWLSMETIRRHIYEMALARMNVLQFHFMENPGCTVALDCYPEMHGYGAENLKYTKDEIREMIAYADDLGIEVTPFIEVLSHSVEFNRVAGIACPGDTEEHMFAVCVGQEKTFEAIDRVLGEIAELFPSEVLHVGADEYDMSAVTPKTVHWDECPHCRALSERMGYTTLRELFLYGLARINRSVNRLGKVAMLWNADLKPGELPDEMERNAVIHYYRADNPLGREKIYELWPQGYARDGFAVLNSYYPETYMDIDRYMSAEKLNGWSYLATPPVFGVDRARVIGGCCCAWDDAPHFARTISPAIFLFADRLWNADGDTVPYDTEYGRTMTRLLFGGALPEDMNVFDAVGGLLPPLRNDRLFHKRALGTPLCELLRIRDALAALAAEGNVLAGIYAEIAAAAVREKEAAGDGPRVRKDRVGFDG